ncbi:MAG: helix-turn-helix transcriptional regulator [Lachnospiraceae bacterium]|nr:helix-turn-helix transcriptional regulator [Lachnospiraceae bacterium]
MKILVWEVRHDKKISLRQLEELSGVSKTTLNAIGNDKRIPNIVQLEKIAKALGVKISDLYESEYK